MLFPSISIVLPQLEVQAQPCLLQKTSKLHSRLYVKAEEERRANLTIRLIVTND